MKEEAAVRPPPEKKTQLSSFSFGLQCLAQSDTAFSFTNTVFMILCNAIMISRLVIATTISIDTDSVATNRESNFLIGKSSRSIDLGVDPPIHKKGQVSNL